MKNLYELKDGDPLYIFSERMCRIYKCEWYTTFRNIELHYKHPDLVDHITIDIQDKASYGWMPIRHSYEPEGTEYSCIYSADKDFIINKALDYKKDIVKKINKSIKELC